jgi:hypothetical protein
MNNDHDKELYRIAGPNLGARRHTLEEALHQPEREGTDELYAPGLGKAPPQKPVNFDGNPVREGEFVEQRVTLPPAPVSRPVSRPPTASEERAFAPIWADIDRIQAEKDAHEVMLREWGLDGFPENTAPRPEGVYTFEELLSPDNVLCHYLREKRFLTFCQRGGYPDELIARRVMTAVGYEKLVAQNRLAKQNCDSHRRHEHQNTRNTKKRRRPKNKSQSRTNDDLSTKKYCPREKI